MSRIRSDYAETQSDGAIAWYAKWIGGPSLAKVVNCRHNLAGGGRVVAHTTGEADTYFSIPAYASIKGCRVRGYLTRDDDGWIFHHCYY